MSYLGPLRLHFFGHFQTDPSTVNNDIRHYDNAKFEPRFQKPQTKHLSNGWWNPDGMGSFRLVGCRVTMVSYTDGKTSKRDPVVGMWIADANQRVAGKLVDLDPQQQLASQIWGMIVRLTDGKRDYFSGTYGRAPFSDIWWARAKGQGSQGDTGAGSMYQSVVGRVTWGDTQRSRFLRELHAACPDRFLSIKFNLDGYNMDPESGSFTMGRLVGTIGPWSANEPKHFVIGRQLLPQVANHTPAGSMNYMQAVVDEKTKRVYADFGNALPTTRPGGPLLAIGTLDLGYLDRHNDFHSLGKVNYREKEWYPTTAGIQRFPRNRKLTRAEMAALKKCRVAVTQNEEVVVQENTNGLYQRADQFVFRLDPEKKEEVHFWATQYGKPLAGAKILVFFDSSGLQPGGSPNVQIPAAPPKFGVPESALAFDRGIETGADGRATLTITASDPKNPRGYIDGQVYGIRYLINDVAKCVKDNPAFGFNPSDFLSVLVYDAFKPEQPVTWTDLAPIFQQYGNLYPIMDGIIDFSSYDSVAANAHLLAFAFGLPIDDPNHMPVTRDLSGGKTKAILTWLTTPGADGKPLPGTGAPPEIAKLPWDIIENAIELAKHAISVGATPETGSKSFAIHTRLGIHLPENLD
jgi:hypothetical protein